MGPAIRPPKTWPTGASGRACGSANGDAGSLAIAVDAADDCMVLSLLSILFRISKHCPLLAYTIICRKNFARSLALLQTKHQRRAFVAKHLPGARLRALPAWRDALQKLAPFRGDLESRAALVRFVRPLLDPALLEHDFEVA